MSERICEGCGKEIVPTASYQIERADGEVWFYHLEGECPSEERPVPTGVKP